MRKLVFILPAGLLVAALLTPVLAQQPGGRTGDDSGKAKQKDYSDAPIVVKMMAFNKKKDGKLTRDEVTDERLLRLFDMADTNKDGIVTKEELMALAAKLDAENAQGPGGDRGGRGPGGDRGPGDRGPGGPGGLGGPGGPPEPGQILPTFLQEQLKLTDDQKKQLADLQKDVDAKLAKILTDDQKKQLKDMRDNPGRGGPGGRGPGGRGGPGGGPGGPGGDRGGDRGGPGGPPPGF
jgi:hypothetical protein